jgi:hypothetical protein
MRAPACRFLIVSVATLAMSATLGAQDAIEIAGTGASVRNLIVDGETQSAVSRDGGSTWIPLPEPKHYLNWRDRSFDPLHGDPSVPAALMSHDSNELFYVQFVTDIIAEYAEALDGLGAEFTRYFPHQAYVVRIARDKIDAVRGQAFVRAVMELQVAHKLDTPIQAGLLNNGLSTARYNIMLVDKHRDAASIEERIIQVGGVLDAPAAGGVVLSATLTPGQLLTIARENTVLWIDEWSAPQYDMDNARIQTGADYVETLAATAGHGIRGHVNEAIYDTHPEFRAIVPYRTAPLLWGTDSASNHGTETAGEIYAQGLPGGVKGLLPFAQMIESNSVNSNRYQMFMDTQNPSMPYKAMMLTQSWGGSTTTSYNSTSALMDDILFDFDHIFVTNSQSNTGNQNSRPEAWAKNVAGVGGFNHYDNANATDDCWCGTGSTGPAQDGRVGVSFAAFYDNIRTTIGPSSYTNSFGGTSGATPIVNGLAGFTIQMFTDGWFGYPAVDWQDRFKARPNLTTTRVLMAVGTRQVDFTGASASTRVQQGWGLPNMQDLFDNRDNLLVLDEEDVLVQGQQRSYWVWVKPGTKEFRASMHYLEDEAVPSAIPTRINSLDLSVTEFASSTRWWGNDQNPGGILQSPWSAPGGNANDIDIHENVFIKSPNSGLYRVTVSATAVRSDSHKETVEVDADFALAIRGIGGGRDTSGMVLDLSSSGFGNLDVSVSNLPAGWASGVTIFSANTARHLSLGDTFGLEFDSLSLAAISASPSPGKVFAFTEAGLGLYPYTKFSFPASVAMSASGLSLDAVVVLFDATGSIVDVSNVDRVTVQ